MSKSEESGLKIKGVKAVIEAREILHEVSFNVPEGEILAILGPNGAGKSTLAKRIAGLGGVRQTEGEVWFNGEKLDELTMEERALAGVMLLFQNPVEIPGITLTGLMLEALRAKGQELSRGEMQLKIAEEAKRVGLDYRIAERELVGLSGGESKKMELLQMLILQPKLVILDEVDSGLDVEALGMVTKVLAEYRKKVGATLLIITHAVKILQELQPEQVGVMVGGRLVDVGGEEILKIVEREGYEKWKS